MNMANNYYNFGLWVYDNLGLVQPKMEMRDVIDIVEMISPDSYYELAEIIIENSLINVDDYEKNRNVFDKIINYLIISFEKKDIKFFKEKCDLLEFILERKN
jgi:hypothetical protein